MGCRPSRSSLGRVGDSSWEYNRQFIKEHKEKKSKSKKTGRSGRRKAPVYNDFSSTSKTYTNLHSKSSRITVRLSTDGSTLEIEQYDIDLNACVDKFKGQVVASAAHAQQRSPYQTCNTTSGGNQMLHRCYSAPQLRTISDSPTPSRAMHVQNKSTTKQTSRNGTSLKPKKSKSAIEKGFLTETNGWCDRKPAHDATTDVIINSSRGHHVKTKATINNNQTEICNNTHCDNDISVLDLEDEHELSKSDEPLVYKSDLHRVCKGHVLDSPCCSIKSGASISANYDRCIHNTCDTLGAIKGCLCSKHLFSNIDSCRGNVQRCIHSKPSPITNDPHTHNSHDVKKCGKGIARVKTKTSVDLGNNQHTALGNNRSGTHTSNNSNICETVPHFQCHTAYKTITKDRTPSSIDCIETSGSKRQDRLNSDIDFSRRSVMLPSQLTNGFKNGDVYSASVLLCSDPKSIREPNSSNFNEEQASFLHGRPFSGHNPHLHQNENVTCTKQSDLRENAVSIETTEKLMGFAEGSNYGSGLKSDLVFLMQNNSNSGCRPEEIEPESHTTERKIHKPAVHTTQPLPTGIMGKYVTSVSGEDTDETNSPDFEESLDESFEKRFDFSNCRYGVLIEKVGHDTREFHVECDDTSGSDIDDEEFLDALESTYV